MAYERVGISLVEVYERVRKSVCTYIHTYIFDEAGQSLATQRAGVDLP